MVALVHSHPNESRPRDKIPSELSDICMYRLIHRPLLIVIAEASGKEPHVTEYSAKGVPGVGPPSLVSYVVDLPIRSENGTLISLALGWPIRGSMGSLIEIDVDVTDYESIPIDPRTSSLRSRSVDQPFNGPTKVIYLLLNSVSLNF